MRESAVDRRGVEWSGSRGEGDAGDVHSSSRFRVARHGPFVTTSKGVFSPVLVKFSGTAVHV
jgi:hypothetical protein